MSRLIPRWLTTLLSIVLLSWSWVSIAAQQGGQFIDDGQYQIHYVALPSTLLTPEIAKNYDVVRSRFNGFINISILDTSKAGNPAVRAQLSGKASNLLGSTKDLDFKEFVDGNAIYYIAEISYRNEEQFKIEISLTNDQGLDSKLTFQKKFWVD